MIFKYCLSNFIVVIFFFCEHFSSFTRQKTLILQKKSKINNEQTTLHKQSEENKRVELEQLRHHKKQCFALKEAMSKVNTFSEQKLKSTYIGKACYNTNLIRAGFPLHKCKLVIPKITVTPPADEKPNDYIEEITINDRSFLCVPKYENDMDDIKLTEIQRNITNSHQQTCDGIMEVGDYVVDKNKLAQRLESFHNGMTSSMKNIFSTENHNPMVLRRRRRTEEDVDQGISTPSSTNQEVIPKTSTSVYDDAIPKSSTPDYTIDSLDMEMPKSGEGQVVVTSPDITAEHQKISHPQQLGNTQKLSSKVNFTEPVKTLHKNTNKSVSNAIKSVQNCTTIIKLTSAMNHRDYSKASSEYSLNRFHSAQDKTNSIAHSATGTRPSRYVSTGIIHNEEQLDIGFIEWALGGSDNKLPPSCRKTIQKAKRGHLCK